MKLVTGSPITNRVQTLQEADKLMLCEWSRKISSVIRLWFKVKFHFNLTSKHYKNSRKISSVIRPWFRVKFHFKWTSKHHKMLRKNSSVKRP